MSRTLLHCAVVAALALAAGCGNDSESCISIVPGPEMRVGWNCLSCHRDKGKAGNKPWTAGGTIYDEADSHVCEGVPETEVVFFDPEGHEIHRVTSNSVGNFYTDFPLPEGFLVGVEREGRRAMMPIPPPAGSCNACHADPPLGEALGRIRAP